MNLFYNPTLSELDSLVENGVNEPERCNLMVDFDGEVLVLSEGLVSPQSLSQFKFYFPSVSTINNYQSPSVDKIIYLNQLFKDLVFCWEMGLEGSMDFEHINKLRKQSIREVEEME
jgi:hypothetical protein